MEKFADSVIRYRWQVLALAVLLTVFFAMQIRHVRFETAISALWPADHPYVDVYQTYEHNYGSPLTVYMMLRVKDGTIYNPETLGKVERITRAIDDIRGVNHNRVVSITSRKVKHLSIEGSSIHVANLLPRKRPETEAEFEDFRERVVGAGVIGTLVSDDGSATQIAGNFIERLTDVQDVFERVQEIKEQEKDEGHEIYLAGQPILMGWVWTYQQELLSIIALTAGLMFLLLYVYIRSIRLTILPLIATLVSAIWGLGFAGLLGYTLDPLILIIPALLMARTLSHGVQKVERIIELEDTALDASEKAKTLMLALFGSGLLGIVTDAVGILVIGLATIPVMQQLAIFCSFWAASIIVSVLILIPVGVSLLGLPKGGRTAIRLERSFVNRILDGVGWLVTASRARWVMAGFALTTVLSVAISTQITIGDIYPGTPLLWPDSPYNTAVKNMNDYFVGTDEFFVIARPRGGQDSGTGADGSVLAEGRAQTGEKAALAKGMDSALEEFLGLRTPEALGEMVDFQRYLERHPLVRGTFSFADFIRKVNRLYHWNYAKWDHLPDSRQATATFAHMLLQGTDPGDFDRFVDNMYKHANVTAWLTDHRGETLEEVVRYVKAYQDDNSDGAVEFQLASGSAGVTAAVNEEVANKELLVFLLAGLVVGVACLIVFRSILAAGILMLPLLVTNFVVMSIMVFLRIGLDVNTLPIVSIGMGVGIDYGIYMLTRIMQEIRRMGTYEEAIAHAVHTTGRAVFFTATVMVVSVGVWYFSSSFRFVAEMGLLLAMVMGVNMLGALLVIPAIITVTRPRFTLTARLLVWD